MNIRKIIIYIFLILFSSSSRLIAESPYKLSWGKDGIIFGVGSVLLGWGIYEDSKIKPLTVDEINKLAPSQVNSFDRGATGNWRPDYSTASDILVVSSLILPGTLLFDDSIYEDAYKILTLYSETLMLTNAFVFIAKGHASRLRPYAYNKDVNLSEKQSPEIRRSFFSGHAAVAFASTVFAATVYDDYFPDSKWSKYIWAGAITASSVVANLRVAAGKHFVTDVIAGAAVGSLAGYLIPYIHKQNGDLSIFPIYNINGASVSMNYKF